MASLPPPVVRSLDSVCDADWHIVGYRWTLPVPEADIATARDLLDGAMQPAPRQLIGRELTRLRAVTVSRNAGTEDQTLILSAYADGLAEYPADAIVDALRHWRGKFWPALAELWEAIEDCCPKRMALKTVLSRSPPSPETAPQWTPPTEAEKAYVAATLARWRSQRPEAPAPVAPRSTAVAECPPLTNPLVQAAIRDRAAALAAAEAPAEPA